MPHSLNPEELYQKYLDLQLRVTRFSSIEQELINTRDQLDHELVMHKRLLEFNTEALKLNSEKEFIQLVAESVIDICESQIAYVYFLHKDKQQEERILEGVRRKDEAAIVGEIEKIIRDHKTAHGIKVVHESTEHAEKNVLKSCMFSSTIDIGSDVSILLAAANSNEKAPFYPAINDRSKILFSVFVQQVEAILSNIIIAQQNRQQMHTIAEAQIELKKLSLIATKTKSGVIISDKHGRIEWVNNSFEQTTGFKLEEVIGKKPKEFLQSDLTSQEDKNKMAKALAAKESVEVTVLNKSKSGHHYYNQLAITPVFDEKGKHINFIALQKDITAEENYKKELIQKNTELEKINKELDQFIYSISHDLRSPLLSIKGLLSLIETSVDEDETKLYHGLIGKSVGRLDNTILEILEYSRNSRVDVHRDEFNLQNMIEQQFQDLSYIAEEGIDLKVFSDSSPIIFSDKTRVETLLKNLISNAIKYRKKNNFTSFVHVKIRREGEVYIIDIIDNGEGISELNQKRVFEMFYRASSSSQGTGLGLAMCQEIVKKLNGEIKLTSQVGEGTTITLILPNNPLNA